MKIVNRILRWWIRRHFSKATTGVFVAKIWCERQELREAAALLDRASAHMVRELAMMRREK